MPRKAADEGWFYHAPARPQKNAEPVGAPPPSQIPGLSELPPDMPFIEPPRTLIKESDSAYIRLAKGGGRHDLLVFRDPKPKPDQAKGYPRTEWYYLEDNALQDAENRQDEPYQFMLPDYMVDASNRKKKPKANANGSYVPQKLPYAFDKQTIYDREGHDATNKTIALKEDRPAGYGVRAERHNSKPPSGREPRAKDDTSMGKILSYGYTQQQSEQIGRAPSELQSHHELVCRLLL